MVVLQWLKQRWLGLLLILALLILATCHACKPTPQPDITHIGPVSYAKSDTTTTQKIVETHAHGTAKGHSVAPKKIAFEGVIKTAPVVPFVDSGFVIYHDTINWEDTVLASTIITLTPTPEETIVKPVPVVVPDHSSNSTFAWIGAALGGLVTIVALFLFHVL